ncbi:MAG: hypothetical protein ACLTR8_04265 [Oscillospiraceae bacterium]
MNNTATNSTPCPTVRKQIGNTVLKEVSAFRVPQEKQRFLLFNTGTTLIL